MREKQITERHLKKRLVSYWERIKKDDPIPDIERFNSTAVSDVWDSCFRISIRTVNGKQTYHYSYAGAEIVKAYGVDPTGRNVVSTVKDSQGIKLEMLDDLMESKEPVISKGQFINKKNEIIKYNSCTLPFGKKGSGVITDAIIGMAWRKNKL